MANIKFSYLYRDGGNYKNYGSVIFSNPDNVDLSELESLIKSKLVYDTWFYHDEWKLPSLRFTDWNFETDPTWHEFENMEYTQEPPNTSMLLAELINNINLSISVK